MFGLLLFGLLIAAAMRFAWLESRAVMREDESS